MHGVTYSNMCITDNEVHILNLRLPAISACLQMGKTNYRPVIGY